jgi:hypothetical protein
MYSGYKEWEKDANIPRTSPKLAQNDFSEKKPSPVYKMFVTWKIY